jgi:bifunctional non-homologous end joining protein LigD
VVVELRLGADNEPDALATYRAKRSADRSPEPVGTVAPGTGRLFVVHKHAARQLHFDLRLEMDGVLRSWAVPRGPSYDQADKRLAVKVEDHPLEYGDFEGVIPEGNYGAGGVIVWDRGEWVPIEDWRQGLEKGKLLFELKGYKLHGKWTLVKLKKSEKDWLLIKERDQYMTSPGMCSTRNRCCRLTVEEIRPARRLQPMCSASSRALLRPVRWTDAPPVSCSPSPVMMRSRRKAGCSSSRWTATGCSPQSATVSHCS